MPSSSQDQHESIYRVNLNTPATASSLDVWILDGGLATNGGLAERLWHPHGGSAVHWGLLDRRSGSSGTRRDRGLSGECAGDQESTGAQERCAGVPVADEAAHLRVAAQFLPATGTDPRHTHDLAAAGPVGEGCRARHPADAESADDHEYPVSELHQRYWCRDRVSDPARHPEWAARSLGVSQVAGPTDSRQCGGGRTQPAGELARGRTVRARASGGWL